MSTTFDPFDELAAMFLSSPTRPQPPMAADAAVSAHDGRSPAPTRAKANQSAHSPVATNGAARAEVEVLIVGHLPVRGGLWLTPYADAVARDCGTAAIIRLDGEEPSLQLLRATNRLEDQCNDRTLVEAVASIGPSIDHWIVRAPGGCGMNEILLSRPDRITILSSADEAAIVAAYQTMKEMSEAAESLELNAPPVSLALVGIDSSSAAVIVEKLNRTTVSFLGIEISLGTCLQRMDAGVKSSRYITFPNERSPGMSETVNLIDRARHTRRAEMNETKAVAGQLYADRVDRPVLLAESILRTTPPARTTVQKPMAQCETALTAETGSQTIKIAPKPSVAALAEKSSTAKPQPEPATSMLASFVTGLTPLPIRAPGHEHIELAVDAQGRMHLLAKEGRGQGMRELNVVANWAVAHQALLAMACPTHCIAAERPICHVFTDDPLAVADLHGTELCLHVLAAVEVNGSVGWYCAPLNVPATR